MITPSAQTVMNGLSAGFSLGLMAIGLSVIWRTSRFLHAAHAATYLVGAYVGLSFVRAQPTALLGAAVLSAFAGAVLGAVIEILVYRRLREHGSSAAVKLLASLAVLIVVQNTIGIVWGSDILTARPVQLDSIRVLGASTTQFRVATWGVVLFLSSLVWVLMHRSKPGILIRAVASDPGLADIHGINTGLVHLATMALVSALAGISGFFNAYETALTPAVGIGVLLTTVTGVIVGGIGTVYGALVGVLLIGMVKHVAGFVFSGGWEDAPVFAILLVFLAFRPYGIVGKRPFKVSI